MRGTTRSVTETRKDGQVNWWLFTVLGSVERHESQTGGIWQRCSLEKPLYASTAWWGYGVGQGEAQGRPGGGREGRVFDSQVGDLPGVQIRLRLLKNLAEATAPLHSKIVLVCT